MIKKLNTRHFIIDLFLGAATTQLTIKQILIGAQIFNVSENSIRVAVNRLVNEAMLETPERGIYQLSLHAQTWANLMLNRKSGIKLTKEWNQKYLAILTTTLGRVDRTALKKRERVLEQFGFKALENHLYIRPDNLANSVDQIYLELQHLGLEPEAKMCVIEYFDQNTQQQLSSLWDSDHLHKQYEHHIQTISAWLKQYAVLSLEQAAFESFHLGKASVSLMMKDPLLPSPFVDEILRDQFIQIVQQLDQTGLQLWQNIYEHYDAPLKIAG